VPHDAYVAALASLAEVGPARLRWLLSLGAPKEVWDRVAAGRLPTGGPGVDHRRREAWCEQAAGLSPEVLWRRCQQHSVGVVTLGSPGYPPALLEDPDPPVVLFHRGDPDVMAGPRVAIVGTRRATGYGRRHAAAFAEALSAAGVSVVSGLALGIDAAAHHGAVRAAAAPPVAVVGGGLDAPCPRRNLELARQVADAGVLLSEVPPGVAAAPWRFPVRNRVIAGLADAVLVVESAGAGGSMHTVREAMLRDRPVLALPGPIDSRASEGTNRLLSEGAVVCADVEDVLVAIGLGGRAQRADTPQRPAETRPTPHGAAAVVLDQVGWRPVSMEQLAAECGLGFAELAAALGRLVADGWVERNGSWVERVARGRRVPGSGGGAA
jgi:DNA processing protein